MKQRLKDFPSLSKEPVGEQMRLLAHIRVAVGAEEEKEREECVGGGLGEERRPCTEEGEAGAGEAE